MAREPRAAWRLLIALFILIIALPACRKPIREMDAIERAKFTNTLREDAERCYERWQNSDLKDVSALECYAEKYRLTTEAHPSPMNCQGCYLRYGFGLRLLGMYYWEEERDANEALAAATGNAAALEAKARAAHEKWVSYFAESVDAFELYVATRKGILPQVYDWLSQQYAELGDYGKALSYLELLTRSRTFNERDQEKIEARRAVYATQYQRQQLEEVRRSLANG